ncbi:hypothetical protein WH87_07855 [Devosia epidermidihirudinis]|uniref:diguanylate cyclase n=1 Tax=Devosia epidermidihirudinis TaxID=1293439 RepID=A0A0F5QDJ9_9HYPH|nr:GGDEF domain-containing protein [Devosia epidermidihirudinis]KKC38806.1 hypothetical protein WH87_07855 [Devosia epidermidihirudinis]
MPSLDFLTLYILIFMNALTLCVIWAAFAYRYRPNPPALYWLAGMALNMIGGGVLAIQGNEGSLVPAILGNTIIILGFGQFWIGLRRFQHQAGGQRHVVACALIAMAFMIACYDFDRGRAIVYATGQACVMGMSVHHLLRHRQPGIGMVVAVLAFSVAALGQLMVIVSNGLVLSHALDFEIYYVLASYALLCTVFSCIVWNLGFAMMTIDRLQDTLRRMSETDELTGVLNRRGLQRKLDTYQHDAKRTGRALSVVLIDLDNFKPLNDNYGHAAGDKALQQLGQLISANIRPSDIVARLGGDEFCVLLPATGESEAARQAETLRHLIATTAFEVPDGAVALSASLGVSTHIASADNALDLLIEADKSLYRDKALKASRYTDAKRA